jgi:hypothetical protein
MKFAGLEKTFEDELVASMADVDRCLTKAYDRKLAGEEVVPMLDACQMAQLHQFILDCGATFTDELYKLTRLSFSPFSNAKAERKRLAEINIKANCTRPPEPPPPPVAVAPPTGTLPAPATSTPPTATAVTPPATAPTPAP